MQCVSHNVHFIMSVSGTLKAHFCGQAVLYVGQASADGAKGPKFVMEYLKRCEVLRIFLYGDIIKIIDAVLSIFLSEKASRRTICCKNKVNRLFSLLNYSEELTRKVVHFNSLQNFCQILVIHRHDFNTSCT